MSGVLVEYSGTNIIPDVWRVGNTGSSTTLTTATTDTTTAANSLVIGACAQRGKFCSEQTSWASSPTNSFSIVAQTLCFTNTSNADRAIAFLERIVTSASTYSTGVTTAIVISSRAISLRFVKLRSHRSLDKNYANCTLNSHIALLESVPAERLCSRQMVQRPAFRQLIILRIAMTATQLRYLLEHLHGLKELN